MIKNFYSIMLSLSGICQSVAIVDQLSKTGECHDISFKVCINSILDLNPDTVLSIYGNKEKNLELGIKTLLSLLNFNTMFQYNTFGKMIRYILNIITLENKLKKNVKYNSLLFQKLSLLVENNQDKKYINDILIDKLSEIYLNTMSKLDFRIHIFGSKTMLNNIVIQNKIRCALLSGIRSAVLWKQLGGKISQLVFHRKQINYYANIVLKKII